MIGAGAIIFDGAIVGRHSILGVGSIVLEGRKIPPRSVAVGAPAKIIRRATLEDIRAVKESFKAYVKMSQLYEKTGAFNTPILLD